MARKSAATGGSVSAASAASTSSADTAFDHPASYEATEPFTRPHTVTILLGLVLFVVYALYSQRQEPTSLATNIQMGLAAAVGVGLAFCAEYLRDTLFVRPHPAIWRTITGVGLFYTMLITFALFQDVKDLRLWLTAWDPKHTNKQVQRDYGAECELTYQNVMATLNDEFVIAHLVGWAFKAWMIRDIFISMVVSFLFELMEYSFTHIQPNFNECWWDHWILDFLLCNTGGIIFGHLVMGYLDSKEYNWVGIRATPTVSGKVRRVFEQFTPRSWTRYEWHTFDDPKRFLLVGFMLVGIMICELDAFFLKHLLWILPLSPLNVYRLLIWWAVGMVALRDYYAFISDPNIKRVGATCWVVLAMTVMELIVVIKFGLIEWEGKLTPPPHIIYGWALAILAGTAATLWWFLYELPKRKGQVEAASASAAPTASASAARLPSAPAPALAPAPASARKGAAAALALEAHSPAKEEAEEEEEEEPAVKPKVVRRGRAAASPAPAKAKSRAASSKRR